MDNQIIQDYPFDEFYNILKDPQLINTKFQKMVLEYLQTNNIKFVYQTFAILGRCLDSSSIDIKEKYNSILAIRVLLNTSKFLLVNWIETFFLQRLFEIALSSLTDPLNQNGQKYFEKQFKFSPNDNPDLQKLSRQFTNQIFEIIQIASVIKPFRLHQITHQYKMGTIQQLKANSNYVRSLQFLKSKNYIPSKQMPGKISSPIMRYKFLQNLQVINKDFLEAYSNFSEEKLGELFNGECRQQQDNIVHIWKLYASGDLFILDYALQFCQLGLLFNKAQCQNLLSVKYSLFIICKCMLNGTYQAFDILNQKNTLELIIKEICNISLDDKSLNRGKKLFAQFNNSSMAIQIYKNFLNALRKWAIFGQSYLKLSGNQAQNQLKLVYDTFKQFELKFPEDDNLDKQIKEFNQNFQINEERNKKFLQTYQLIEDNPIKMIIEIVKENFLKIENNNKNKISKQQPYNLNFNESKNEEQLQKIGRKTQHNPEQHFSDIKNKNSNNPSIMQYSEKSSVSLELNENNSNYQQKNPKSTNLKNDQDIPDIPNIKKTGSTIQKKDTQIDKIQNSNKKDFPQQNPNHNIPINIDKEGKKKQFPLNNGISDSNKFLLESKLPSNILKPESTISNGKINQNQQLFEQREQLQQSKVSEYEFNKKGANNKISKPNIGVSRDKRDNHPEIQINEDNLYDEINVPNIDPRQQSFHSYGSVIKKVYDPNIPSFKACFEKDPYIIESSNKNTKIFWLEKDAQNLLNRRLKTPKKRTSSDLSFLGVLDESKKKYQQEILNIEQQKDRKIKQLQTKVKQLEYKNAFRQEIPVKKELEQIKINLEVDRESGKKGYLIDMQNIVHKLKTPVRKGNHHKRFYNNSRDTSYLQITGQLIHSKQYKQHFQQFSNQSEKKLLLRNKQLLFKDKEIQFGWMVRRQDDSLLITFYITPEVNIENLTWKIQENEGLKIITEPKAMIKSTQMRKQQKVCLKVQIKKLPYFLPIIQFCYEQVPSNSEYKKSIQFMIPCGFHKYFFIKQIQSKLFESYFTKDKQQWMIRGEEVAYSKKILKNFDNLQEYFPTIPLQNDGKPNEKGQISYGGLGHYKTIRFPFQILIKPNYYLYIQGNIEGQQDNYKAIQFYVCLMTHLLKKEVQAK